jgi:signal transduction histidine kinase
MTRALPLQILVVDDMKSSRRDLCALVRELGHEPTGADSGREALQIMGERSPDLVLLDLLMPDMDGFEVSRRMKALTQGRWIPVIVTSSLQGDEHFTHALNSGADDYLSRPVNVALLEAKLRHYSRVLSMQLELGSLAKRQKSVLDNILDPVVTVDSNGVVEEFNQAAERLAYPDGHVLAPGAHASTLFGLPWPEPLSRNECRLHRADGSPFFAEIAFGRWEDNRGEHVTLVLRDVTERRQMDRMKEEFLATVSHELRTPLTSVMGAISLMAGGAAGQMPPAALMLADMAQRNGERLGRLIDDILDLTKLEGGQLSLKTRPQPLEPLLREALEANQGYASRANVQLQAEGLETNLGDVALDGDRFLQVMANLLSNAIKHSPGGGLVRVILAQADREYRVTVRDEGPGIDRAFRARMFSKFAQDDGSDRRAQGGTGLGLYITRMLIEHMGGRITADEVEGTGASFSVWLSSAKDCSKKGRKPVLHVERDLEVRNQVARGLSGLCEVIGAADLVHAREKLLAQSPLLVIGNPQSQGAAMEFCLELRSLAAGCPVLLFGDGIDADFSRQTGLPWLSPSRDGPQAVAGWVQRGIAHQLNREKRS